MTSDPKALIRGRFLGTGELWQFSNLVLSYGEMPYTPQRFPPFLTPKQLNTSLPAFSL